MSLFDDVMGYIDAGRSAKSISDANIAAEHGVLGAAGDASRQVFDTTNQGTERLGGVLDQANAGLGTAGQNVTQAATDANTNLAGLNSATQANLAPSIASGAQGNTSLQAYAANQPKFSFNPTDLQNDPGYQFQLSQGKDAITNQASASGLSQGGNVLESLTKFGQGLAGTYYNDAFNRAQQSFNTNQNATLQTLGTLINSGAQGNALSAGSNQFTGGLQSGNTTGAAGTNASLAQYGAGLNTGATVSNNAQNLQGAETAGNFGLTGSKLAGDYAIGAGTAHAAGINGQGAALSQGVSDLAGLVFGGGTFSGGSAALFGSKP